MYGTPEHEEELLALEREDHLATPGEADREYAHNTGSDHPEPLAKQADTLEGYIQRDHARATA